MLNQKVELQKKREFGDVLNASFAFIKQEYKGLGRVLLLYAGIPVLVQAILSTVYVDTSLADALRNLTNPEASQDVVRAMPGKAFLFNLINVIVQVFLSGLAYCYIVLYAKKGDQQVDIKEVWHKFTSFFGAFLGYNILTGLILVVAFLALILPGLYIMVPLSIILIVKVAEDQGYGASFSRCFYLIKNHWWQTFGLLIIASIILLILSSLFGVPAGIVAGTQGILNPDANLLSFPFMLTAFVSTIGTAIVTPIPAIILSFQYYSLVEHKDNTALLYKIDKINENGGMHND
ncbi:hypothetical protein SAMN06265379_11084 [Saccharicrinis carchari]|uniref:DUF7847 domain-containing protein n=1 Tax=Saccharicrinis carchari TaxID=1168039 RepID=A0A521ERC4_SACCC|nr:hypothetical protein [Saccharicrinis carchari]SMO85971.1 hypothetical protein SAMN06265379_11084 [Saccharicrinis carchari]